MLYRKLSDLYGQLRGYDRLRIRRQVRRAEGMPAEELQARSLALLRARVREAIERFPAYREKVEAHGCDAADPELAPAQLPVWTRKDQNALFASLAGPPVAGSFAHATGGSSGQPTRFYITRESYEWRTAVSDRGYAWAEAEEGRRSFYVWGTPIHAPARGERTKSDLHHWLQRRAYFDSFHFSDQDKARCCREIDRARPHALVGYAGNLVELAVFVRDNPQALHWRARTAVTAAEGLAPGRRELIEEWLADEVFLSYGSREFMLIGMECSKHTGYHLSSDNLLVEVVDERGAPCTPGHVGRITVTDLHNVANPFIRYEIGDLGVAATHHCPCKLPFPQLSRVEGRVQEVIVLPDGTRLTALFIPHLMKEFPWIDGYQLRQESRDKLTINIVSAAALSDHLTAPVAQALREKVGPELQLDFRQVDRLERNRSGKTPIVVSG